jgi:hypothetical protein
VFLFVPNMEAWRRSMDLNSLARSLFGLCSFEGEGGAGAGGGGGTGGTGGGGSTTYDEAYVKRLRDEAAAERTKHSEASAKLADYEKKQHEAEEKAAKEAGDWKKLAEDREKELTKSQLKFQEEMRQRDLRLIHTDLKEYCKTQGLTDEAFNKLDKLIDLDKVKYEDGKVVGHEEQITALKTEMPFLFKGGATGTGGDGRSGGSGPGRSTAPSSGQNHADRTAVNADQHKSAWASLGQR